MTEQTIESGKAVFGHDGRKGEYVAKIPRGHLVRPIAEFTDWDGDTHFDVTDALEMWERVYPKAPRTVVAEEIETLLEEQKALQAGIAELEDKTRVAQREHLEVIKRLKRYEPLAHLEDVLNGTITHVVEMDYRWPSIKTLAEALPYRDNYDRKDKLRFLTLAPTEDGVISWHLARYAGGEGDKNRAYLCKSREEALEIVRQMLVADFDDSSDFRWPEIVACARKCGTELPAEYVERAAEVQRRRAQEGVDKAAKALADAQAHLSAVGGEAPQ